MVVNKKIGAIKFSLFSPQMIRDLSSAKITIPDTYDDDSYPIDGGLVDPRMGVIDPGLKCKTCGGRLRSCPGHFGHIELVRPVIHPLFSKTIYFLLKSTCPDCKRTLASKEEVEEEITEEEKEELELEKAKAKAAELAEAEAAAAEGESEDEEGEKKVVKKKKARRITKCPHCGAKCPEITMLKPTTYIKNKEAMLSTEVRDWLAEIPNDDLRELNFDPIFARPEWMILTALLVPPVNVRPSITLETGDRSEDDLTHKLVDIMRINQRLEANINAGAPQLIIEDLWELLQYHVTTYFNNQTANIPPARHRSGRPLKTLSQRLKGKEGRFRYNLSGKRVNFSARTVISPEPNISIDQVGVPMEISENMTVPIRVTSWNIEQCKSYIKGETYPRALYVVRDDGKKVRITDQTKEELVTSLANGYVVERQLADGDTVLFNRQPSLHRNSIMCHNVRILPGRTLRLNPIVCPPYNADFDGDEMNLHVIQSVEARVEAEMLLKVHEQIISPRHGHPIIKPEEDYVSGVYYLTRQENEFDRDEACRLLAIAGINRLPPQPDRGEKYSGKVLFSMLLPKELNVEFKTKLCRNCSECPKKKCPYDAYVWIENGVLRAGALERKAYENEVLEKVVHMKGTEYAKEFLDKSTRISLAVISKEGFTVSARNYTFSKDADGECEQLMDSVRREVDGMLVQYRNKSLKRMPGRTLRESLEDKVMEITSKSRDKAGKIVEKHLGMDNTSIIMARIGSRGSLLNAIQMTATVGQQAVRGKRVTRGYHKRTLLHFKPGDLGAASHGFVASSFRVGLSPTEFFHHAMGGRESLVNTAIRTARSGYMQRRLINALQDIVVSSDTTVRDARGVIVQFTYGGDGLDPMRAGAPLTVDTGPRQDDVDTA